MIVKSVAAPGTIEFIHGSDLVPVDPDSYYNEPVQLLGTFLH